MFKWLRVLQNKIPRHDVIKTIKNNKKQTNKPAIEIFDFLCSKIMTSTPSPGGNETLPSSPSSSGAQNAKAKR